MRKPNKDQRRTEKLRKRAERFEPGTPTERMLRYADRVERVLQEGPDRRRLALIFAAVRRAIDELQWDGACHATTAVAYAVLREAGLAADPCIGEVGLDTRGPYFDHSWIEIAGKPYDVAITRPLVDLPEVRSSGVFNGIELATAAPSPFGYGVTSGRGFDPLASAISELTLGEYIEASRGRLSGIARDLWQVCESVAARAETRFDLVRSKIELSSARWIERTP